MAGIFKEVHVFALRLEGNIVLPKNVHLFCIGGQSRLLKALQAIRTYGKLRDVLRHSDAIVLYHMMTWPILLFGMYFKIRHCKQGVWYSHNYADFSLRSTQFLVDKYFSPTIKTFPLFNKSKLVTTGHSINFTDFPRYKEKLGNWQLNDIYYIGRIAPVKRLELLIEALSEISYNRRIAVTFKIVGPTQDSSYLRTLFEKATDAGIQMSVMDPLRRAQLIPFLKNVKFAFSGTPASVDKSILEACGSGAIPITDNSEVLELTGMHLVWKEFTFSQPPSIQQQIDFLIGSNPRTLLRISAQVQESTRLQNDFEKTLRRVKKELS